MSKYTKKHHPAVLLNVKYLHAAFVFLMIVVLFSACIPKKKHLEVLQNIERKEKNLNKLQQQQQKRTAQLILLRDSLTKTKALQP